MDGGQKKIKKKYFTFPIELMKEAFVNINGLLDKAICYSIYARCEEHKETPKDACSYFKLSSSDSEAGYQRGKKVFESFERAPLVLVSVDVVLDFYKNPKTDFEIAVFCAFCGLRSIIGTKKLYVKTNNRLLLARMFGFRSAEEFEALGEKPAYYKDYFSTSQKVRYQLTEKIIKNELSLHWGLKYYSFQSKGFYAAFNLDYESLVFYAESGRKSNLLRKQREQQKQIIESVRRQVRGK